MTAPRRRRALGLAALVLALAACAGSGVNPTGLAGGQVACKEGPRQTLDCRGAIQQYAKGLKVGLGYSWSPELSLGQTSTKLAEVDALTSDLVQHYYQTCALYNACLITRDEYVARTEKLQAIQMDVRQAAASAGATVPASGATGAPGAPDRADTILGILRQGQEQLGDPKTPAAPPGGPVAATKADPPTPAGSRPDLDGSLRSLLVALKQDVARQEPARASGRTVVGNFTEEGKPWSSPLGALLQDRVALLAANEGLFAQTTTSQTRGITLRQVAAVEKPNEPRALGALYDAELAISGTYRPERDWILVRLAALDDKGRELGQARAAVPLAVIPRPVALSPSNAADTSQLLSSLDRLGPQAQGAARVEITTSRPGAGASFRLGEPITYFVTSTVDGYLYLFHVDADRNLLRIFPNPYQRDSRIRAGSVLEVPGVGAPFAFEASPPFGLETTFAIVTAAPLNEEEFQKLEGGFTKPKQDVAAFVASRARPARTPASTAQPPLLWSYITVLIRP